MRKILFTHLFIWCVVLGFASTAVGQDNSAGKVPMTTEKPTVNYGITNEAPNGPVTAYGWGSIVGQFLSMPIPAGTPFTLIGALVAPGFLSSGCFGPTGILYFTDTSTSELYTVNLGTGAITLVGSTGAALNGITYDWSTETFFAVSSTDLYTVNVSTGTTTLVGFLGSAGFFIDIAASCDGLLYGYDLSDDNFYSIDPATGAATIIGVLGYDANFGQGMSYDYSTGILYLSAFNNGTFTGQLRTVDVATGMTTLVFDWGFEQVAPFAIDQVCGAPCTVGAASNPDPADGATDVQLNTPNLSWTNGAGATELEVIFDGGTIYTGPLVTSVPMPPLSFGTTYSWKVNSSDGVCTTFGPTWTFTTKDYPNIILAFLDDFEDMLLTNWDITNDGGTCDWIPIELATRPYTMPPNALGWGMTADADLCGSGTTVLTTATMNVGVDATQGLGYQIFFIEFDHDFRTIDVDDNAIVEVSLDGGATWTEVVSWLGVDARDEHYISAPFSTSLSNDIRFRLISIQPGWDWWWAIDNFAVYLTNCLSCINPPSDLTAIAQYENSSYVLLNWVDNSNDEETFHIERKLGDSGSTYEFSEIGIVSANVTAYTDNTVADTTIYTYRVRGRAPWGTYSPYSNEAEVMTIIPVELISFAGNVIDGKVQLRWSTATETNNMGFEIYRANQNGEQSWKKIGFMQGHGTTTEPQSYSFMDESILSGTYQYRLKQLDYDGSYEYSNIIEVEVGIPTEYSLEQNYPNPFNPTTTVRYEIPALSFVTLKVYDVLGSEIATLVSEEKPVGNYEVEFDGSGLTSGVYFYTLQAGDFVETKKIVLMK